MDALGHPWADASRISPRKWWNPCKRCGAMRRDRPLIWRRPSWKPWPAKQKTSIRNIRGSILDLIWLDDFVDDSWIVWIFPKRVSLWCSVMFRCYCLIYYNKKKETLKMGMSSVVQLKLYPHTPGGNLMGHCKSKDMEKHHQRLGSHREHPGGGSWRFFGGGFFGIYQGC